jgi:hypothetical protein
MGNVFYADALVICGEADIIHESVAVIPCSIQPQSCRCS